MKRRFVLAIVIIAAVGAVVIPGTASAVEDFDPYVALFAGWAMPANTDVKLSGSPGTSATVHDVELNSSLSFGGKAGVWMSQLRDAMFVDFGLELDVTHYTPSQAGGKRYNASGQVSGIPVTNTTTQQLNFSNTLATINLLARLPLLETQEFPDGRLFPYIGGGIGLERMDYRSTATSGDVMDLAYQVKGGIEFYITHGISAFVEAKYTMSDHTFKDGAGNDNNYTFNVLHTVGGLALHF